MFVHFPSLSSIQYGKTSNAGKNEKIVLFLVIAWLSKFNLSIQEVIPLWQSKNSLNCFIDVFVFLTFKQIFSTAP